MRLGLDEEVSARASDQPRQRREDGSIRGLEDWTCDLATQDRHLLAQHRDLDGELSAIPPEPAQDRKDRQKARGKNVRAMGVGSLSLSKGPGKS